MLSIYQTCQNEKKDIVMPIRLGVGMKSIKNKLFIVLVGTLVITTLIRAPRPEFEKYDFEKAKEETRKTELKADKKRAADFDIALRSGDLKQVLKETDKFTVDDWLTSLGKQSTLLQQAEIKKSFIANLEKTGKTAADYQKLTDHFDTWSKTLSETEKLDALDKITTVLNATRQKMHDENKYEFKKIDEITTKIPVFYEQMALATQLITTMPESFKNFNSEQFRQFLKSFDIAFNKENLNRLIESSAGSGRVIQTIITALPKLAEAVLKNTIRFNNKGSTQEFKTFITTLLKQFSDAKSFDSLPIHTKNTIMVSAQVLDALFSNPAFAEFVKKNQPLIDVQTLEQFKKTAAGNKQGFDYLALKYDLVSNGYANIDAMLKNQNSATVLPLIADAIEFLLKDLTQTSQSNRAAKIKILLDQFEGKTNKFNLETLLKTSTNKAETINQYQVTMFDLLKHFNNALQSGALSSNQVQRFKKIITDNFVNAVKRFNDGLAKNEFAGTNVTETMITSIKTIDSLIKTQGIEDATSLAFELLNAAQSAPSINKTELLQQSTALAQELIKEYNILVNPSYETYTQLMHIRGIIDPAFINDPAYKKIIADEEEKAAEQKQKLEEKQQKAAAEKAKQEQEALIKSLQEDSKKILTSDKDRSALLEKILALQNTAPAIVLSLINDFIANNAENITQAQANLLMNSEKLLADVKRTIIDQLIQSKLKPDVALQVITIALQRDNDLNLIFKKLIPLDISRSPNIPQLINRRIQNAAMFKAEPLLNEYLKNNPLETISGTALKNINLIMTAAKETDALTKILASTALKEKWSLEQVMNRLDAIPETQAQILVEIIPVIEIKGVDSINQLLKTLQALKNRVANPQAKATLTDRQLFIINKLSAQEFERMSEDNVNNINTRISELMPEVSQLKDIKAAFDISVATLGRIITATKMRLEELEYQKKHPWLYSLQNTFWSFLAKSFDYSKLDKTANKATVLRYADEVNKYITESMRESADPNPTVQNKEEKMFTEILNNIDLLKKKLSA